MAKTPRKAAPKFLKKLQEGRDASKTVSVRISERLHSRFTLARDAANKAGFDLEISEIVRAALEEAIEEAKAQLKYDEPELDLVQPQGTTDDKPKA